MFDRFLFCLCLWRLLGVFGADEVKSVMEGESVTLNITVTEIKDINMIMWKSNKSLIAKISREFSKITVYDNDTDGRFRDRLQLDHQTGSLIITDTRTTDSGDYEVTIFSSETTTYTFRVTVFAATTPDPQTPPYPSSHPPSQSPSGSTSPSPSKTPPHSSLESLSHPPDSLFMIVLIFVAAVAGSLVIVAVILMFCICRKHRDSVHEDETQAAVKLYKHTGLMKESDVTEVIYMCFITEQSSNSL
uniref:Immunoglobulin domain-containing protein n=1 Tax=Cyprinus carpio TaxID=7962 RepID=A0A8C1TPL7_CYPCA